ncbi:MAG TPA: hypothetical protein VNN10_04520 [Dehalococcoidia bacterium]|nr:hypothetical protein [Dehalococcoidia bacterium]
MVKKWRGDALTSSNAASAALQRMFSRSGEVVTVSTYGKDLSST